MNLHFLILLVPSKQLISLSFKEGEYFLEDAEDDFGEFYILETEAER